jgi:hypothetical protein
VNSALFSEVNVYFILCLNPLSYSPFIAFAVVFAKLFPNKFSLYICGMYPAYPGTYYALILDVGPPIQFYPFLDVFPYCNSSF